MPRRTPTELVAEETATSSPVRRSSRVAARRSSTEAAQTTAKSTRTRRASQEDSLDDYVEYKPATRTRRANSLLDEEKDDGKKQSGRQPAKRDPPATRRRNSTSSEPEEAKPATRRRKSSADSVEEEPTRRVTRGRRSSVDKDDEEAKKTPVKTRRRLSVTDNVSKMEAIEEQTKEESPKPNVDLKLSVLREEEDEPPKKSPKLELNNISAGSDGSFRFNLNVSVPSEELNESKTSSNNSDKENSPVKQQQNEIVDVFKPKMRDISFVEPMEVDVTINQTRLIDLNSPNRSRLSLRKSLDKNCDEMDDLSLRIDDDDDEEPIKVTNILTVEEKVSAGGENKGTKVLQVELVDVVFEDDEKTGSESDENRTGVTRRLQVDLVDEVFNEKSTSKTLKTSSDLISRDDDEEAKKNDISIAEKAAEEKINDEKRLSAKQKSSASPKNEIEKETNEKRSPSKENQVLVQDDVNKSNKMASTPDKVDEKTEQRSKNDSYSQSPKDGSRSEGEKSPVSKKKLSTDVTVEEVAESTITTRSSLKKRLSGSPISKMGDLNGISENESTSQKRLSDEEGNASIDKSPTKRKTVSGGVDGEEKKIVTRSASKQRYSDRSFSKSGHESFDDEEKSVDKITKTSSCSPDEGKTVNTHSLSSKSDSFSKNEDFEERTNEEDNNSEENSASSGVKLVKTRSSLKNRWSSSPNIESVKPTKRISNNSLSGSSFEEKTEDSNEESEDGESENVTKRFSGGSEIIKTRSSLKKASPNVSTAVKTRSSLDKNHSRNENVEISSDEDKSFETKKKNMSGSSFEEKNEVGSNEESEDAESENVTKRFSGGSEIIKTRSSLKKTSPNVSTAVKTRSSLDKNHSRNENIEISSDEDKSFETKKKNVSGSSFEEKNEELDSNEESEDAESENVTKRFSSGSEIIKTRSSLKKASPNVSNVAKTRSSLDKNLSRNENIEISSDDDKNFEIKKKNMSGSSFEEKTEDSNEESEDAESENVTKRFSGGSEIIKTRSSLKKASPNVSTAVKTRSSLDKNHSRNENIEISSDDDKSFETKKNNVSGSSSEEEIEESKNEEDKNVSRTSTSSESVQTRSSLKKRLSESPKVAKTRSSLSSDSFSKNEDINLCSSDEEDKEINSSSSSNRKTVQDTTTKTENSVSVSKSEDQKFVTDKRNSSTPNKKLIEEKPMKKTRLVNIDPEASAKLDRLLEQILSSDDEEQTEEEETNSLFDDMAEEGEEDTPSEDSNAIVDEGESIHSTDTEERQHDDEDYEKDSFICDDEIDELLSGEEYDLSSEKNDDLQPNDGKSGRIAQRPVDEMDEQEDVIIVNEEKKENKIKILENITLNPPNNEIQDASLMKRRSNHKRTSSISILENLKVEDLKETDIGERISDIVESFCNNKSKGEISMNLSLEYAENSSSSEDNDSMRISRKRKSDESEDYSKKLESPPSKKSRKSIQQDKNRRHSVSFDETVNENKIDSTKKRLSKSAEKLPVVKKLKSKKDKKQMNDLKQQTFNIFDQLINEEKKNRPVRKIFPSRQLEQTNNTWRVEKVVVKPSTTSITKEERAVFSKMERKIHPKDFKNQMLYNKNRVARVDTKKLLDKKRAF